jgi:hypothetical protein
MTYPTRSDEHYYAAVQRGRRVALAFGPFPNHSDAAKTLPRLRTIIDTRRTDVDGFDRVGVAYQVTADPPVGRWNEFLEAAS